LSSNISLDLKYKVLFSECIYLGVVINSSSVPVLRGNRIFEGGTTGIEIRNDAGLLLA
jgi:hypothetical protein